MVGIIKGEIPASTVTGVSTRNFDENLQVLQHLSVPETFSVINEVIVRLRRVVHVPDTRKPGWSFQEFLETADR